MKNVTNIAFELSKMLTAKKYTVISHFAADYKETLINAKSDLDILCVNKRTKNKIIKCLGAKKVFNYYYSSCYKFLYNGTNVYLDLFTVNDGFYPKHWAKKMIVDSVFFDGLYFLNTDDSKYSLLYHLFFHKKEIGSSGLIRANTIFSESNKTKEYYLCLLIDYMDEHKYSFTKPLDKKRVINYSLDEVKDRLSYPASIFIKHAIYNLLALPILFIKKMCRYVKRKGKRIWAK